MRLTDYHAKYMAHELTRRCPSDSVESLAATLVDAQVDLNPHQFDAALFAFQSPLSRGALLADEVGLGKTIEAGLVLSQRWAERKRRILVITPANLRKQWYQELTEKFFLPCRILEAKSYNAAIREGRFRPFEGPEIVICSYQFARGKAADVHAQPWDLVVIDEAHRLRNVCKPGHVIAPARRIREARRAATAAPTLEEKLAGQKQIKALEGQRNRKRRSLFDALDETDRQREAIIAEVDAKLAQRVGVERLFVVRWRLR